MVKVAVLMIDYYIYLKKLSNTFVHGARTIRFVQCRYKNEKNESLD